MKLEMTIMGIIDLGIPPIEVTYMYTASPPVFQGATILKCLKDIEKGYYAMGVIPKDIENTEFDPQYNDKWEPVVEWTEPREWRKRQYNATADNRINNYRMFKHLSENPLVVMKSITNAVREFRKPLKTLAEGGMTVSPFSLFPVSAAVAFQEIFLTIKGMSDTVGSTLGWALSWYHNLIANHKTVIIRRLKSQRKVNWLKEEDTTDLPFDDDFDLSGERPYDLYDEIQSKTERNIFEQEREISVEQFIYEIGTFNVIGKQYERNRLTTRVIYEQHPLAKAHFIVSEAISLGVLGDFPGVWTGAQKQEMLSSMLKSLNLENGSVNVMDNKGWNLYISNYIMCVNNLAVIHKAFEGGMIRKEDSDTLTNIQRHIMYFMSRKHAQVDNRFSVTNDSTSKTVNWADLISECDCTPGFFNKLNWLLRFVKDGKSAERFQIPMQSSMFMGTQNNGSSIPGQITCQIDQRRIQCSDDWVSVNIHNNEDPRLDKQIGLALSIIDNLVTVEVGAASAGMNSSPNKSYSNNASIIEYNSHIATGLGQPLANFGTDINIIKPTGNGHRKDQDQLMKNIVKIAEKCRSLTVIPFLIGVGNSRLHDYYQLNQYETDNVEVITNWEALKHMIDEGFIPSDPRKRLSCHGGHVVHSTSTLKIPEVSLKVMLFDTDPEYISRYIQDGTFLQTGDNFSMMHIEGRKAVKLDSQRVSTASDVMFSHNKTCRNTEAGSNRAYLARLHSDLETDLIEIAPWYQLGIRDGALYSEYGLETIKKDILKEHRKGNLNDEQKTTLEASLSG